MNIFAFDLLAYAEHLAWIFHKKAQTSCKALIEWKV
jgi:hypothetical protein